MTKNKHRLYNKHNNPWLFRIISKVILGLASDFVRENENPSKSTLTSLELLVRKLTRVYQTQGKAGFLDFIKKVRSAYLNFLSEEKERPTRIRLTSDGLPTILGDLLPIIRGSGTRNLLPFLNTILWASRSLKIKRAPDLSPITDPGKTLDLTLFRTHSRPFGRSLGFRFLGRNRVPKQYSGRSFRLSTKGGPNGQALYTSIEDLYSLPDDVRTSVENLGGHNLKKAMAPGFDNDMRKSMEFHFMNPETSYKSRRLTYFPDKEGKQRVIAILDYGSQESLRPLHDFLFDILKRIPQDCTYNQDLFRSLLEPSTDFYSIDLTAATDRFPISVIATMLRGFFSPNLVKDGETIMVSLPFHVDDVKQEVKYSVGNPMGAYSSGASFALCNHFIVYICCERLGRDGKSLKYSLLGDDIVIADKEIGEEYIRVIRSLGVEISELKTHKSQTLYEMAKRLIYKGQEITPFPVSALVTSHKRYYQVLPILLAEQRKGGHHKDGIPLLVEQLYTKVYPLRRKLRKRIKSYCNAMHTVMMMTGGSLTPKDGLNHLIGSEGLQKELFQDDTEAEEFLFNFYNSFVLRSLKTLLTTSGSLFDEKMSMDEVEGSGEIYSLREKYSGRDSKDCYPISNVVYRTITKASRLESRLFTIDPKTPSDGLVLRAITVPLTSKVFTMRSKDLLSLAAAKTGRALLNHLISPRVEKPKTQLDTLLEQLRNSKYSR